VTDRRRRTSCDGTVRATELGHVSFSLAQPGECEKIVTPKFWENRENKRCKTVFGIVGCLHNLWLIIIIIIILIVVVVIAIVIVIIIIIIIIITGVVIFYLIS